MRQGPGSGMFIASAIVWLVGGHVLASPGCFPEAISPPSQPAGALLAMRAADGAP